MYGSGLLTKPNVFLTYHLAMANSALSSYLTTSIIGGVEIEMLCNKAIPYESYTSLK